MERQRPLPFGRPAGRAAGAGRPDRGHTPANRRRQVRAVDSAQRAREALRRRQFARLMERLRADAEHLASHFGLRYRSLLIERPTARSHYGICYQDGTIKIRLNHAVYMTPLRYSSLVNTVCHELAHLRHFDHGEGFKRFYYQILEWARAQRIYRPARPRPEQAELDLAMADECEVDATQARVWLHRMRQTLAGRTGAGGRDAPRRPGSQRQPASESDGTAIEEDSR
jgi:hypothetical protein